MSDIARIEQVFERRRANHYEVLELPRDATQDEVRAANRLHSQAWAPDKMPAAFKDVATRRAAAINEAYTVLSDPKLRKQHDASLPPEEVERAFFDDPLQNVARIWMRMAAWMKEQDVGAPFLRKMAFTAGDCIERRREPSDKQRPHMLKAWDLALEEGFDPAAPDQ